MAASIPHLRSDAYSQQLIIHDEPFLVLGGEVQNSQFSSSTYMEGVWKRLKDSHVNTVFGSVTWEQIEPVEGKFYFEELDKIVFGARKHGLHIALLWFGSFKNGLSTYTPPWVKLNATRFPRAELHARDGKTVIGDVLSIFGSEAQQADALAFASLLSHIRSIDEDHSTVIMVQVENEVGLLGDSRDRSDLANLAWTRPIPPDLLAWIVKDWPRMNTQFRANFAQLHALASSAKPLTWSSIPVPSQKVDELFMAYHYSLYVEAVAAAGKSAFPLPMFTNVWQNYANEDRDGGVSHPTVVAGGGSPGDYPSGGGVTDVLDVWKMFAPSIDFIAPDIYLNDYERSCAAYRIRGQALLIPEQRRDEYGARRTWAAFGTYGAIGMAPFGIDTQTLDQNVFRKHYGLLEKIQRHILNAQRKSCGSFGFFFDEINGVDETDWKQARFGRWELKVERAFVFGKAGPGCGMIIHLDDDEFLLAGWGFQVSFSSTDSRACFTGLMKFEEKFVNNSRTGELNTLRLLNGDETRSGKCAVMPNEDPDYGGFPISITIPANTGIAVVQPYVLIADDLDRQS